MVERLIHFTIDSVRLEGMLNIPDGAKNLVLFAHGSGSSRLSPRNKFVADVLNQANIATFLIDLLSRKEDENYQTRFDISLLTKRFIGVIQWLERESDVKDLSLGIFGASTGAAAALEAAALQKNKVKAVVSRGGRPDLTMELLDRVEAPTLLIVGGEDFLVVKLNEEALKKLTCEKKLEIIPNATHLFEEPGCLEEVAKHASQWFEKHF